MSHHQQVRRFSETFDADVDNQSEHDVAGSPRTAARAAATPESIHAASVPALTSAAAAGAAAATTCGFGPAMIDADFAVVGGGIAGVTCAQQLCLLNSGKSVVLVSASPVIKIVADVHRLTRTIEEFNINEVSPSVIEGQFHNLRVIVARVIEWQPVFTGDIQSKKPDGSLLDVGRSGTVSNKDVGASCGERAPDQSTVHIGEAAASRSSQNTFLGNCQAQNDSAGCQMVPDCHLLRLCSGELVRCSKLCICTGAIPKRVFQDVPGLITIRDTETVDELRKRLSHASSIAVIGNGGIANELVYKVKGCSVHWIVRHDSIGATFFDAGAAKFFIDSLSCEANSQVKGEQTSADPEAEVPARPDGTDCPAYKRLRYTVSGDGEKKSEFGTALGPDWAENHELCGAVLPVGASSVNSGQSVCRSEQKSFSVEYNVEVESITLEDLAGDFDESTINSKGVFSRIEHEDRLEVGAHKHVAPDRSKTDGASSTSDLVTHGAVLACSLSSGCFKDSTGSDESRGKIEPKSLLHGSNKNNITSTTPERRNVSEAGGRPKKYKISLSNGRTLYVDLVISAIGVQPNPCCFGKGGSATLELADDGGILVNGRFETSVAGVFAAGDVCTLSPEAAADGGGGNLWLQMRLWTQARQMGDAAARAMTAADELIPPYFEVFAHATHFFGYKVVLLGLFNGQQLTTKAALYGAADRLPSGTDREQSCVNGRTGGQDALPPLTQDVQENLEVHARRDCDKQTVGTNSLVGAGAGGGDRKSESGAGVDRDGAAVEEGYEVLVRVSPGLEYVKLILKDGRMKGAVLVGETDLEEVIENLLYSQLDLTDLKDHLLDPGIDLEDYFD